MDIPLIHRLLHLKPRVVHKIPGRIRVHIPALRHVTTEFQSVVDVLVSKFSYPVGILKVTTNYITGNLLILYDKDVIQESDVLVWLSDLSEITGQIWIKFRKSTNGNSEEIGKNLLQFFVDESKNGNILDKNIIIPDYVWN